MIELCFRPSLQGSLTLARRRQRDTTVMGLLLDPPARRALARQWDQLRRENVPLRIVKAGVVRSAEADHYDPRILAACPDVPCRVAELIGQLVGWQLGIDDQFWAARVKALLDQGKLKPAGPSGSEFYQNMILRK